VVLTYALGRTLFGLKAGIIAGVVLTFGFLHATLSRDGIHYIQGPTACTLALLFFALTIKHGGRVYPFLCGFAIILCIQVYWSARIAFLLIPFLLAWLVVQNRPLFLARWRNFGWLTVGILVAGLPIIALFMSRPEAFGGHQDAVFIFNSREGTQTHLFSTYGTNDPLVILGNQFMRNLLTFVNRADSSLQVGYNNALVDPVTAVLLAVALLFGLAYTFKHWQYTLCTAWFFSVFFSGVLTIDPPWWPRLSAFLPAIALLIGAMLSSILTLVQGWFKSRPAKAVPAFVLVILLGVVGALNLRTIFVDFPANGQRSLLIGSTLLGHYLAKQPENVRTLYLTDNSIYLESEAVVFLAPKVSANGCTLRQEYSGSNCGTFSEYDLFIMMRSQLPNLDFLKKRFPDGKVEIISTDAEHGTDIVAFKRY
jgi:hypothetical protein